MQGPGAVTDLEVIVAISRSSRAFLLVYENVTKSLLPNVILEAWAAEAMSPLL